MPVKPLKFYHCLAEKMELTVSLDKLRLHLLLIQEERQVMKRIFYEIEPPSADSRLSALKTYESEKLLQELRRLQRSIESRELFLDNMLSEVMRCSKETGMIIDTM